MKTSRHVWPVISEATQERCLQRLTGRARFTEGLGPELFERAVRDQIDEHGEPRLLAFAYGHLREHDPLSVRTEAEKYLLLAALNLVDCIAATAPPRTKAAPARRVARLDDQTQPSRRRDALRLAQRPLIGNNAVRRALTAGGPTGRAPAPMLAHPTRFAEKATRWMRSTS